jgi:CRISPR system Cascade subunit CasB
MIIIQKEDEKETGSPDLLGSIGRIAGIITSDGFPSGDRAALKRLSPGKPPPLAFYRFAFRHLPEGWEIQEKAWMTIVGGITLMFPHPHHPDRPVGRALAEAGFPESRLERLLDSDQDVLKTLLLRAARFLSAKMETINWNDFARLLLTKDPNKLEATRLKIARDYYRNLKKKE